MGMDELLGEVAEHGGAAGRDAAFGDLNDEAGEEFLNVLAPRRSPWVRGGVGGEILGVAGRGFLPRGIYPVPAIRTVIKTKGLQNLMDVSD